LQPSAAVAPPAAAGPKVAFLGDSISAGLHLPAEQAFPAVLRDRLAARGLPFQLLNAGVSGDTTAGGLRRVDWILRQSPQIVVVELGANDSMRGQPIAAIEQNLRGILSKLKERKVTALLLGMRIPTSYGPEYAAQFEAIYPRVAKDTNVPFVPFFMEGVAGVPEQNLEDGIHPTPEGHVKLAKTCEEALAKLVAAATQAQRRSSD
jgi:acyl-CoA thioesterase-1